MRGSLLVVGERRGGGEKQPFMLEFEVGGANLADAALPRLLLAARSLASSRKRARKQSSSVIFLIWTTLESYREDDSHGNEAAKIIS